MYIKDIIIEVLKQTGVDTLFAYPTTEIIESAAAKGIRPILCRQERVGVDMAHGYARVKNGNSFGVFAMQYGPGAENAFSGVATAWSDSAPVLLLPLGHPRDISQTFHLFSAVRSYGSITKSAEQVVLPNEIINIMRRAINGLRNGRLGPVLVEVPTDVIGCDIDVPLNSLNSIRTTRSAGDERDISEAAKLLLMSKCPVIQAGQGVLYSGASDELIELAELLNAPVTTTVEGKSAFPENHRLSLGCNSIVFTGHGRHFLQKTDLIFGIGTSFTRHYLVNPIYPHDKKFIHVTNDSRDFNKGYNTDVCVLGDVKLVLRQFINALKDLLGNKSRDDLVSDEIAKVRTAWIKQWRNKLESTDIPITPYRVISEFMKVIPSEEAIVTHDSGSPRDQITPFYQACVPNSYLGWGKSHALGTGLGLTIGAKVAKPEKFCVNFMGDAAFGMTGLDFETAARSNIPILTVLLNNNVMAVELDQLKLAHNKYNICKINGNYSNIAKDLGGWSERIVDPQELGNAFIRARRETENGKAALLEIITNAEKDFSFRKEKIDSFREMY